MSGSIGQIAFHPNGNTVLITAASPAPVATLVPVFTNETDYGQYRIINVGSILVYLGFGPTAAIALSRAVAPAPSANTIPLVPGAVEVLRLGGAGTFFTCLVATAGTSAIYLTPGAGI